MAHPALSTPLSTPGRAAEAWQRWAAVAVGGAAGSVARYLLTLGEHGFGLRTLAVNVLGSFLLAYWVFGLFARDRRPWLRPLLGTGLLGGFTTFSTVMAFAVGLGPGAGAAYVGISAVAGFVAAALGARTARRREPSA